MRVELRAIALARRYFQQEGYSVQDVSRKRGHNGYDFLIEKSGKTLKVEVKGATRRWGIPDPYNTEFDEQRRLVADLLCVVYFIPAESPKLCLIPRDAISPEYVSVRTGFRISSRFKNQKNLEQYLQPFALEEENG